MKAIDFACHLLVRIHREEMTPRMLLTLMAVGSGASTTEEILRKAEIASCAGGAILNKLTEMQYICRIHGKHYVYALAPAGREKLIRLFSFCAGKEQHHGKETAPEY